MDQDASQTGSSAIDRYAIVIGAMKSGTTSLFQYLSQHPQIAASRLKEPAFFSDPEIWARGFQWYSDLWSWQVGRHRWALEATTEYTKRHAFPETAARMASLDGEVRLLYVMRDPIRRIESHYRHLVLVGDHPGPSETDGELDAAVLETSCYASQLDAYTAHFKRDQILLLAFEELKTQPEATLDRVVEFLELDGSLRPSDLGVSYNESLVDHPLYTALTRSSLARQLIKLFPVRSRALVRRAISRKRKIEAQLSAAQRRQAEQVLSDEVRRLRDDYGFETAAWDSLE